MPWTVGDVDSHKKGLSAEQKKKWVAVANGTLKSCQKNGAPKGKTCDQIAIMTANSRTGSALRVPKSSLSIAAYVVASELEEALGEDIPLDSTPPKVHSASVRTVKRNSLEAQQMWNKYTKATSYTLDNGFTGKDVPLDKAKEYFDKYSKLLKYALYADDSKHVMTIHWHSNHWLELSNPKVHSTKVKADGPHPEVKLKMLQDIKKIGHGFDYQDLSGINASGENLAKLRLGRVNLSKANLSHANLSGASLYEADLRGANLSHANLSSSGMYGAKLANADLTGADLTNATVKNGGLSKKQLDSALNSDKIHLMD